MTEQQVLTEARRIAQAYNVSVAEVLDRMQGRVDYDADGDSSP